TPRTRASQEATWLAAEATLLSLLVRRLAEPLVEPDGAESGFAPGNQRAFTEFGAEVPRVRIGDNLAAIVVRGKALADQFVETELLRTGHFDRAVHRSADGDLGNRLRDVICRHRLKEHRRHPDRRSNRCVVGNAFDELEELRGMNDRVGDPARFDQSLLSVLRAEIRAVGYPLGAHH